jgi:bis(5'-nucleosidyl)-tetraphosphatase
MRRVQSCGVICFRNSPRLSFLLMEHSNRLDLPKGHRQPDESEVACALRELFEETGIHPEQVTLEVGFRFATTYHPQYKRFGGETVEKEVVIFLGWLPEASTIQPTEHQGFRWVDWSPPHQFNAPTIDALLEQIAQYFADKHKS